MTDYRDQLALAYVVARYSHDPSTQNAAILYGPDGQMAASDCNSLPRHVADRPDRWKRPLKYSVVEHAERNVIYACAHYGIATDGLTMVAPWAACCDCARAIIQAGIVRLVRHKDAGARSPERWATDIAVADEMLREAGVEIINVTGRVCADGFIVRHSEQEWTP